MPKIGSITASSSDTFTNKYVPEYLLIDSIDTDNPLSFLSFSIGGKNRCLLTGQNLVAAAGKLYQNSILGADVKIGWLFKVADGYYGNQEMVIKTTNAVASAYSLYGISTKKGAGRVWNYGQSVITDGQSVGFSNFLATQFLPTNISQGSLQFVDGENSKMFSDVFLPAEMDAIFADSNPTDADGKLSTITTIDARQILVGGLYCNNAILTASGADVTVNVIRLDTF